MGIWRLALLAGVLVVLTAPAGAQKASGQQGDTWASIARLPDWSGAWIIPFDAFGRENVRIRTAGGPDAPRWLPEVAAAQAAARQRVQTGIDPAPGSASRQNSENCLPTGMPNAMRYAFAIEFIFTPGRVTILGELDSLTRRIYTDGRPHTRDPELTYTGESIGHWESDTLVVHTRAISPSAEIIAGQRGSGRTEVAERIRLVDAMHLRIDTVVEDPGVFAEPWRYSRVYERIPPRFFENHCQDNNRDVNGDEPDLTPPGFPR